MSGTYSGRMYGGTCSTAKYGLIYIYIYALKYGGPSADGGHPGGRQTGERADTPAGSGQGGRYTTDGHTCLRYGGREDTEGAPTWRQGRRINTPALVHIGAKRREGKVWLSGHMIHSIMTRRRDGGWACRGKGKRRGIDVDTRK
jgi:hypothetical protein